MRKRKLSTADGTSKSRVLHLRLAYRPNTDVNTYVQPYQFLSTIITIWAYQVFTSLLSPSSSTCIIALLLLSIYLSPSCCLPYHQAWHFWVRQKNKREKEEEKERERKGEEMPKRKPIISAASSDIFLSISLRPAWLESVRVQQKGKGKKTKKTMLLLLHLRVLPR